MKIRYLLLTHVGLAISLALPIFAQERKETKPKILAAIQANDKAYDDAFNKHDAAAIAALFATNAVMVAPDGFFNGREFLIDTLYFPDANPGKESPVPEKSSP